MHQPENLAGKTTSACFPTGRMVECLVPWVVGLRSGTKGHTLEHSLLVGWVHPATHPHARTSEGSPATARVLGQPWRLFQLQKELIRAEGAGGSGSEGGSAREDSTETTGMAGVGTALPQPGVGVTLRVGWAPPASHAKTMTAIVRPLQTQSRRSPAAAPAGHQAPYRPIWTTIPPSWETLS